MVLLKIAIDAPLIYPIAQTEQKLVFDHVSRADKYWLWLAYQKTLLSSK